MNLQEETRDGYLISAQMKRVWAIQLELLKKLLEVCDKYNLRIWASGGTLIGAIRHRGYIPWDDDIDMVMFRDDYDRLVHLAPKEFDHPYFFQCAYTENLYPRGHAQLRMDGTTAILPFPGFIRTHQGVFIDIFPYDAVPNDPVLQNELIVRRDEIMASILKSVSRPSILIHPLRFFSCLVNRLRFKTLFLRFEDLLRENKIDDNSIVSCISFTVDPVHLFREKHWYENTIYMPFEDLTIPVPIGYHEILTKEFGDYMTPVRAPSYHGSFWKLDPDTDYKEYLSDLKLYFRRLKWQSYIRRIKRVFDRSH